MKATWVRMIISSVGLVVVLILGSCAASRSASPYRTPDARHRNSLEAEALTRRAAEALEAQRYEEAESLLTDALDHDIFYGPAHNNLGIVHLVQGRLYEAAHEFEWARRLLPDLPQPRINLALTMERAGRVEEALASYESALEVARDHVVAMQGLVRLQVAYHRQDDRTADLLQEVALRGETPQWREWAQWQLARLQDPQIDD